ncbi:MAG: hypothetical protein IPJ94_19635 [Chloroflexi bacterium]|nr:hypothetical protein [Chloroflexota bacterium]
MRGCAMAAIGWCAMPLLSEGTAVTADVWYPEGMWGAVGNGREWRV